MTIRRSTRFALVVLLLLSLLASQPSRANQGSYDTIRVEDGDGNQSLYRVWLTWPQMLLTTPDGGAWVFFTGQAGTIDAPLLKHTDRTGWRMVVDPAGQNATTDWRVLGRGPDTTWLELAESSPQMGTAPCTSPVRQPGAVVT